MIRMRSVGHLPVEDLGDEDEVIAARARTAEAEATAEEVAVWAAPFSEVAGLAGRALVDGVGDEGLATPEIGGHGVERRWGQARLARAIGVLLAGIGAVASAGGDAADLADGAAAIGGCWRRGATVSRLLGVCRGAVTGGVTQGDVARPGHRPSSVFGSGVVVVAGRARCR
jgi:hypothetical protein